ncbi:MAG: DUF4097 domain-containing protein [Clostridiales bacterium]|nr:DUF4097 domain-containing protein [Clostridiales bacterium]
MKKISIIGLSLFVVGLIGSIITLQFVDKSEQLITDNITISNNLYDINDIDINLEYFDEIYLVAEERQDIKIEYKVFKESHIPSISSENNNLTVKQGGTFFSYFNSGSLKWYLNNNGKTSITINLPQKQYNRINFSTSIGEGKITDINTNSLVFFSNIGNFNITANSNFVDIESDLGSLEYTSLAKRGSTLEADTNSGSLTINNASFDEFDINADIGELFINGLTGKGKIETNVGSVDVNYAKWDGDLELSNNIGDVNITLPNGSGAYIESASDIGKVAVQLKDFNSTISSGIYSVNGDGMHKIKVETDIGNVKIRD